MENQQAFRNLQAKFQASQADSNELSKKPPKPEFNRVLKKFASPEPPREQQLRKPEPLDASKKPTRPELRELSEKPPLPPAESGEPARLPPKPPQPEPGRVPPESKFAAYPRKFQQPESAATEVAPRPSVPEFSAGFPKKPPVPEFSAAPPKPSQSQAGGCPKKSLPSEKPRTPTWKAQPVEPQSHSLRLEMDSFLKKNPQPPEFNTNLRKPPKMPLALKTAPRKSESGEPQAQASRPDEDAGTTVTRRPVPSELPRKPQEFGDLSRTTSEPQVNVTPKRPEPQGPPPKRLPQFNLGGLPRTTSEPEFGVLPGKAHQPGNQGTPRKFSQPEPRRQLDFLGDLPRKPPLPGSISESSLPNALLGGSSPRQHRVGGSRSSLPGTPRRRPLPPSRSLGPPPAKPPLPPGPVNIQSFRRPSVATLRTEAAAGVPRSSDDDVYELYDDVEPDTSSQGRDDMSPPKRTPPDPELSKKAPPPQQLPPAQAKNQKQLRKAEKAEREFRKKFKFEGEIVIQTRMMIDPNAKTRRGGGKHLGIRRGEILEVIEFTSPEEMLCRDAKGKYGYVPRTALLPLETEVYDDVGFWDPYESQLPSRGR